MDYPAKQYVTKEIKMLIGNFNIAGVQFVEGYNTGKVYSFALFDDTIIEGDYVLCDTQNGFAVAKVVSIETQESYNGVAVTKEIICKLNFADFEKRKEIRKKATELKAKLDREVKKNQDITIYETVAKNNPAVAEMLKQYKELLNT